MSNHIFELKKMSYIFKYILFLFLYLILFSCTYTSKKLNSAEQQMNKAPNLVLHDLQRLNPNIFTIQSDKALYALLMSQALDKNDIKVESDSLISIATKYFDEKEPVRAGYAWFYMARCAFNRGDAKVQADALLNAQEYAEKTKDYKLRGLIYSDKGVMYGIQRQFDSSIFYANKAYLTFMIISDYRNSILGLLNIGYKYLYISDSKKSICYFLQAKKLSSRCNDAIILSTIYRYLGIAYYQQKNYQKALYYYRKAPITNKSIYDCNKWYLIAKVYVTNGNSDSARYYLKKVNKLFEMAPDYYQLWQTLYEKEGKYYKALYYSKQVTLATDSLYRQKLDVSFAGLEKKYKYKNLQVSNQQLIIENKQDGLLLLIAFCVLSLCTIIVLFWRNHVKNHQLKVQLQLLEYERKLVEKEKVNINLLEQQLKIQNILLLNVEQYRKHSIKRPERFNTAINPMQNKTFYDELIACVDIEYRDISKRLLKEMPDLTERDILVSCLLIANFDSGMIASILDIKIESINTHRYRLRTKLGLQKKDNLVEYLRHY